MHEPCHDARTEKNCRPKIHPKMTGLQLLIYFPDKNVEGSKRKTSKETFRTNVASVGSVFNDTRKVKVLSLPETIKENSTIRTKALRRDVLFKQF